MGGFDRYKRAPEVDQATTDRQTGAPKQPGDDPARSQVEDHGADLKCEWAMRSDPYDQSTYYLSYWQVRGRHRAVIDQTAEWSSVYVELRRINRKSIRIDTLDEQVTVPNMSIDIVG